MIMVPQGATAGLGRSGTAMSSLYDVPDLVLGREPAARAPITIERGGVRGASSSPSSARAFAPQQRATGWMATARLPRS
ncbi:hypothetical protein ACFXJJ_22675, partial [Streptomyces sp. NPDC059233]